MNMKRFIIALLLMIVLLTGCSSNVDQQEVNGIVTQKMHVPHRPVLTQVFENKNWFTEYECSEMYLVTIEYEDAYVIYDYKTLYDSVEVDQSIKMILSTTYDQYGFPATRTLRLP